MYARVLILVSLAISSAAVAHAQDDHAAHHASPAAGAVSGREGSGTSWLPDESAVYGVHRQAASWMLMFHGTAFLQHLRESGDRGSHQTGSINWVMAMAQRPVGAGRLTIRGMLSAEPWSIGGCGYPDLLATGEWCEGHAIHDRQHPHDLVMELAAEYNRPIGRGLRLQFYGGPAGEPALGPVAFMHRGSGLVNPLAPITHHWFDATHITFGVATAGVYSTRWKIEGSLFNGREPDENRTDFDLAAMDSWSGRVWFLPTPRWALQFSGGRLTEAESGHDAGDSGVDVDRITASATYHRLFNNSLWATTVGWGRNVEGGEATNALLVESALTLADRHAWYGRLEWGQKTGHDLDVPIHDAMNVTKLQAGYTRYFNAWRSLVPGVGAAASVGIVPAAIEPYYGRKRNPGFAVYVTVRPSRTGSG